MHCRLSDNFKMNKYLIGPIKFIWVENLFDDNYTVSHGFYLNILNDCGSIKMEFEFHLN